MWYFPAHRSCYYQRKTQISPWIKINVLTKKYTYVLLYGVSDECEQGSLYVSKIQPINKIHAQSYKRNHSQRYEVKQKQNFKVQT